MFFVFVLFSVAAAQCPGTSLLDIVRQVQKQQLLDPWSHCQPCAPEKSGCYESLTPFLPDTGGRAASTACPCGGVVLKGTPRGPLRTHSSNFSKDFIRTKFTELYPFLLQLARGFHSLIPTNMPSHPNQFPSPYSHPWDPICSAALSPPWSKTFHCPPWSFYSRNTGRKISILLKENGKIEDTAAELHSQSLTNIFTLPRTIR